MTATEPVQGGPYPEPDDAPDGPNQMAAIVAWAAGRMNMRFASEAARDAALPAPTDGQVAFTGTGAAQIKWERQNGTWRDVTERPIVTYVPVITGAAIGTGGTPINTAKYTFTNGLLQVEGQIKFGTTGCTFPGIVLGVSLPDGFTLSEATGVSDMPSQVTFTDVSAPANYKGMVRPQTTTSVRFVILGVSGTLLIASGTSTTTPFTWQINDEVWYRFTCLATKA